MDFELSDDQVALQDGVRNFCDGRFPIATVRGARDRAASTATSGASWPTWVCSPCACPRPTAASGSAGPTRCSSSRSSVGRWCPVRWCGPTSLAGLVDGAATGETIVGGIERDDPCAAGRAPRRARRAGRRRRRRRLWRSTPASSSTPTPSRSARPAHPGRPRSAGAAAAGRAARSTPRRPAASGCRARRSSSAPAARPGRGRHRPGRGVRQGARAVRPPDRRVPGRQAPDGRHVRPRRGGPRRGLRRRRDPRRPGRRLASSGPWPRPRSRRPRPRSATARRCIQVHGGMGYTWEVDAHLFLKRAYALEPPLRLPRGLGRRHGRAARHRFRLSANPRFGAADGAIRGCTMTAWRCRPSTRPAARLRQALSRVRAGPPLPELGAHDGRRAPDAVCISGGSPVIGSGRGSSTSVWRRRWWSSPSSSVSRLPIRIRRCSRSRILTVIGAFGAPFLFFPFSGRSGARSTWPCDRSSSRKGSHPASNWPTKWISSARMTSRAAAPRDGNDIAGRAPRPITRTDGDRPPCVSGRRFPRRLGRATRPRYARVGTRSISRRRGTSSTRSVE